MFNSLTSPITLAGAQANNPQTHLYTAPAAPAAAPKAAAAPAPTPTASSSGSGGGGGTTLYTGPTYAQQQAAAAAAAKAKSEADFGSAKNTAYGMISTDQNAAGTNIAAGINDFLYNQQQGQTAADREAVQNALAQQQGRAGVLDMIGNGIKSSGVTLAGSNASDSSAADALARAYGIEGRAQLTNVGNQYAQAQNDVSNKETDLQTAANYEKTKLDTTDKATAANSVINDAVSRLAYLNQQAQYMSIPDRIDVDQQKQQIYDQTMQQLSQYDQLLSNGLGGITPLADSDVQKQAAGLLTAGTAPATSFNYTTIAPSQVAGTGPSASSLPLYVGSASKKTDIGV